MSTKKLTILGKSDATITMILDNLESNQYFPKIKVINNLTEEIIKEFNNNKFEIVITDSFEESNEYILGVFTVKSKNGIINKFEIPIEKFLNIYHQSCQISSTTKIGYGCMFNSFVSIASHSNIGNFVSINRHSSIGHHTIIDDFVTINPNCGIAGNIYIGKNTQIGIGTNIINGVKIGKNTIIGAGSLVTKDIPDNVVAYGNPCKIIRENG